MTCSLFCHKRYATAGQSLCLLIHQSVCAHHSFADWFIENVRVAVAEREIVMMDGTRTIGVDGPRQVSSYHYQDDCKHVWIGGRIATSFWRHSLSIHHQVSFVFHRRTGKAIILPVRSAHVGTIILRLGAGQRGCLRVRLRVLHNPSIAERSKAF